MGQTGAGSFIITAYTPALLRFHISKRSEEIHFSRPRESESYTGRQILDTFERALKAVRAGLDEYRRTPLFEPFLEAVPDGVSYELTRALGLMAAGGDSAVAITRYSNQGLASAQIEIAFEAVDSPILQKVADTFALDPEPLEVSLVGEVTLLSRSAQTHDRVIRLNIEDGADIRKARIRLSAEQYEIAMEAHRQEASLSLTGRLEKEGRLYWVYNPDDLRIMPNEETEELRSAPIQVDQESLFD
jgi:hypothetical protein